MQPQALPSLADLSYQLANQNARVVSLLDSLPGMVDQLLFAAKSKDWPEVSRLAAAAQTRDNELEIQKQLVRLVGLCGRVQNPPASA